MLMNATSMISLERPAEPVAYVLGLLYGRSTIYSQDRFRFVSKNGTLIDIVRTELESQHKVIDLGQNGTAELCFGNVPHLYQTLQFLGLDRSVRERPFPDLSDQVISHFMRGIVEGNAGVYRKSDGRVKMSFFKFGYAFLASMHSSLQKQAAVAGSGPRPRQSPFSYSGANVNRVRDFIYRDREYLEDTGLFVPEVRSLLDSGRNIKIARPLPDFAQIERMLLSGTTVGNVADQLGYSVFSFYKIFTRHYSLSPKAWLKESSLG